MNRALRYLALLAVALGAGLGLGGGGASTSVPSGGDARAATPVVAATDLAPLDALPTGCSLQETAGIVTGFLDAVNRGDGAALDALLPDTGANEDGLLEPGAFLSYGFTRDRQRTPQVLGGPGTFGTRDPAELLRHFATRHEAGERLTLRELQVVQEASPDTIGLTFRIERTADDLPGPSLVRGKGGVYCPTGQIDNWQSSTDPSADADPPPTFIPLSSPVDLLWAIRADGLTGISMSASDLAVRRLFPNADYVSIYTVHDRVEQVAEPMTLISAGHELTEGAAAADAQSLVWTGTVVDDVAGGNVHVYQAEHLVMLYLGDDPAALDLLDTWIGPPLAG